MLLSPKCDETEQVYTIAEILHGVRGASAHRINRLLDRKGRLWQDEYFDRLLRQDEFFMLGDNSAQSKDSRLWNEVGPHLRARWDRYQLGTVPRDQLIGRAFFVYWPSGLRTRIVPFLKDVGWIPNFGRMRWIR